MMVLSRNYSLHRAKLDRAIVLAEQAMDQIGRMRTLRVPARCTDTQWRDYLYNAEKAA
jgi:hypothetical protein